MKKLMCLVPLTLAACGVTVEDRFPAYHEGAVDKEPVTLRQTPPDTDLVRPFPNATGTYLHATDRAFDYSGPAKVYSLRVAGRDFQMRIVDIQGVTVAVLDQPGVPLTFRSEPDLSAEVQAAVASATGCGTPGGVERRSYPNGAHSRYAVPLTCG